MFLKRKREDPRSSMFLLNLFQSHYIFIGFFLDDIILQIVMFNIRLCLNKSGRQVSHSLFVVSFFGNSHVRTAEVVFLSFENLVPPSQNFTLLFQSVIQQLIYINININIKINILINKNKYIH